MSENSNQPNDMFPGVIIALLKGIVYRDEDQGLWQALTDLQMRAREYLEVMGLELMLDDSEGYAWLRQLAPVEGQEALPRLVTRRQLSYPVSLLIALLRRRLAEHDAFGGETRLILPVEEIVEMCRTFFPANANDARFFDQIGTHINKVAELGFVRKLKGNDQQIEVCRIIRAFVDAQWLNEFDQRLREYQASITPDEAQKEGE
ncbi:MAG: hypothetical protein GQF41_1926 [Candidatus Rifleibacterium amylolyticum]|nr:MAG: hypothetical protein GQF41_1926 [Candidatus Rifleibacterium amylolyticum]